MFPAQFAKIKKEDLEKEYRELPDFTVADFMKNLPLSIIQQNTGFNFIGLLEKDGTTYAIAPFIVRTKNTMIQKSLTEEDIKNFIDEHGNSPMKHEDEIGVYYSFGRYLEGKPSDLCAFYLVPLAMYDASLSVKKIYL